MERKTQKGIEDRCGCGCARVNFGWSILIFSLVYFSYVKYSSPSLQFQMRYPFLFLVISHSDKKLIEGHLINQTPIKI